MGRIPLVEMIFVCEGKGLANLVVWASPVDKRWKREYKAQAKFTAERFTSDVLYTYYFMHWIPAEEKIDRLHHHIVMREQTYNGTFE